MRHHRNAWPLKSLTVPVKVSRWKLAKLLTDFYGVTTWQQNRSISSEAIYAFKSIVCRLTSHTKIAEPKAFELKFATVRLLFNNSMFPSTDDSHHRKVKVQTSPV
jgi:hypothetical protein